MTTPTTDLARAEELLDLGRHAEAEQVARRVLASEPRSGVALHLLGRSLHGLGRHKEAEHALRAGLAARPTHAGTALSLSEVLAAQDRIWEASQIAREVVRHEPHWWVAHYQLAATLVWGGRDMAREAVPVAEQVVRMVPNEAAAHNLLGLCHERNKRRREARAAYAKALELDPTHAVSMNNLAVMDMSLFRLGRGSDQLRRALALDPSDPIFQRNLSVLIVRMCGRLFLALLGCGALIGILLANQAHPGLRAAAGGLLIGLVGWIAWASLRTLPKGVRRPRTLLGHVGLRNSMVLVLLTGAAVCVAGMAFAPDDLAVTAGGGLLLLVRVLAVSTFVGMVIASLTRGSSSGRWRR